MFLGDFSFPRYRLFVMGFTAVMLVGLWLFIEKTPFGLIVRIGSRKRFREMLDRIEIDGDFYTPTSFTLIPRDGSPTRFTQPHRGRGLRHEADEVARCLRDGLLESPLMPLDETISIMETMDAVLAQAPRR